MLQGAHHLAQGVALQVEEDQLGAGGKRLECSRLLETLGRRVKESLAGSPRSTYSCAPITVFPHEQGLLPGGLTAGILHASPEGVRFWAGTANTCPQGPGRNHKGQAGCGTRSGGDYAQRKGQPRLQSFTAQQ